MKNKLKKIVLFFIFTIIICILSGICSRLIAPDSDSIEVLLVNIEMNLIIIGGILSVILLEVMEMKK